MPLEFLKNRLNTQQPIYLKKKLCISMCVTIRNMSTSVEVPSDIVDRVIEMAWEDRTPFEAIAHQYGLSEKHVIALMRREMKPSSFRMWRKRVSGRTTKHLKKRGFTGGRFRSHNQK